MIDIFLYVENAGSVQFNIFIKQKIVDRSNKNDRSILLYENIVVYLQYDDNIFKLE